MKDIIISALFIVVPVIVLLIAFLLGMKRNIYQAVVKIIMTVISIVVCAIAVKTLTPSIILSVFDALGVTDEEPLRYLLTSPISADVIRLISSIIMPLVFFVAYLVVSFIFSLLYLIPGRLLSNKAFARRAALKATQQGVSEIGTDNIDVQFVEEVQQSNDSAGKRKTDWSKVGLRAGVLVCSTLSALLVLSALALPINTYSSLLITITEDFSDVVELDNDMIEIVNVVEDVNLHPTNQCYAVLNTGLSNYFDSFSTNNGTKVIVSESISSILTLTRTVAELDTEAMNSELFYSLADEIGENKFVCDMVTQVVCDLCNAWLNGESFLGASAPGTDSPVIDILLNELSGCDDITIALRAVGNALMLQEAMVNNGGLGIAGDTSHVMNQIFDNINSDSVEMIKTFVSEEVLTDLSDMSPAMAQNVSGFVGYVMDGIIEIKQDPNLSDSEKAMVLEREAKAMAAIVDMTSNIEAVAPNELIGSVVDSSVISDTIQKITDNGAIRDPYEIADAIAPEFTETVADELKNQGIDEDSELYSSIMALIGK